MCLAVYGAAVLDKVISKSVLHHPLLSRAWLEPSTLIVRWGPCRLATFYSRSRKGRWCKGETSGHYINVLSVHPDCDRDSLVYLSSPIGPACHTARCPAHCCLGMLHLMKLACIAAAQTKAGSGLDCLPRYCSICVGAAQGHTMHTAPMLGTAEKEAEEEHAQWYLIWEAWRSGAPRCAGGAAARFGGSAEGGR